jgi:hypothetical protein
MGKPSTAHPLALSAWCLVAAFGTYFCMYAFRKPFTAANYADESLWGIGYKTILITAQVLGYTVSKFVGIKVIAEMRPQNRAAAILVLIGVAELALLAFGLVPPPYNCVCLFVNGLPLGMVFGLVLGFLEGRRQTEALTAGLCVSFIVSDGVTKSVGSYLLQRQCPVYWMPFATGLIFAPPLLVTVWMLTRIPAPSAEDVTARSERVPMDGGTRWRFFARYAVGLTALIAVYMLITVVRNIRGDFAPEIWSELGVRNQPEVFASSEMFVGIGVLLLNGLAVLVGNNRSAFGLAMAISLGGLGIIGAALFGQRTGTLPAFLFMVLLGLGLYLPYVAIHTTVFERLIAMTRDRGNIGYLLTLADAIGYLGYVGFMLTWNLIDRPAHFLDFFLMTNGVVAAVCVVLLILCWRYFAAHPATLTAGPRSG